MLEHFIHGFLIKFCFLQLAYKLIDTFKISFVCNCYVIYSMSIAEIWDIANNAKIQKRRIIRNYGEGYDHACGFFSS